MNRAQQVNKGQPVNKGTTKYILGRPRGTFKGTPTAYIKIHELLGSTGSTYMVCPYKVNLKKLMYDTKYSYRTLWRATKELRKELRDKLEADTLSMYEEGKTCYEIAEKVGLSRDTVYRVLRVARDKRYAAERAERDKVLRGLL